MLQSLPVIHDGNPTVAQEDGVADDRRDDIPVLEIHIAEAAPAVQVDDIRIVAFDPNTLIVSRREFAS